MTADDPWRGPPDAHDPPGPGAAAAPAEYGAAPGCGPPLYGPRETSSRAVVVLVCAIASFVVLPLLPAVAALVLSSGAQREIAASGGRLSGAGLVQAGRVVAWVNVVLSVLVAIGVVAAVAVLVPTS